MSVGPECRLARGVYWGALAICLTRLLWRDYNTGVHRQKAL